MKLLPPIDAADRQTKPSNDLVKSDGYSLPALERLLQDCEDQPQWRDMADLCCQYYDKGGVYSPLQEYQYRKDKLEPRLINLVGRVVNGVLGQEAKSRRDPHLEADDDEFADVADVLNVKLKEAQRETMADMAISNGYASQVKTGIGWVEVSRNSDPFQYGYRVQEVHRSEIWWDWRAKTIDLRDARWLVRREWKDLDEVIATFPKYRQALENAAGNWATWLLDDVTEERMLFQNPSLNTWYKTDRSFRVNRAEWIDGGRRRIRMYEVWYRVPAEVVVMVVGHRTIIVDQANPLHREAIARGVVKLKRTVTMQVRRAIFAGPYRLIDEATTKTRFPYIPFFAFRGDADNTPYGLIHGMVAPSDEYNERRMRIQWMLKAQQLLIDSDALDEAHNNITDIAGSMMRPDMVAVLDPNRKNVDGIKFRNDFELQKEQFELMQDAKGLIQDVPGVYSTQLGNAPTGVTSGLAINSLVDQGLVAMGELNDNYGHARRLVYESLIDLISDDYSDANLQVAIGTGPSRRVVVLNTVDPQTGKAMNVVKDAKVTTGLAEVPATPAYMMQMSQMMGDMVRALAGTPQGALMVPAWVETTSAFGPGRKQLADDMRRMSGFPVTGDRMGAQQWQQQQQQAQAEQAQSQAQAQQIEMKAKDADAHLTLAKADAAQAQAALFIAQAEQLANEPNEEQLIQQIIQEAMQGTPPAPPGAIASMQQPQPGAPGQQPAPQPIPPQQPAPQPAAA